MKKFSMFLIAVVAASPMFAQTAPARIAVINVQKVLTDSSAGKVALERLKKVQEDKAAKAQKMTEEMTAMENEMNQKKLSLTEDKLAQMQKDYSERKINLQRYAQDADRELQEARDQSLQALNDRIMPIIDDVGKEMGFAVIFNKFESGLVYASEAIDITDVVIKRFNEATEKQATSPAPAPVKH
jgi:outer membrane protein